MPILFLIRKSYDLEVWLGVYLLEGCQFLIGLGPWLLLPRPALPSGYGGGNVCAAGPAENELTHLSCEGEEKESLG